MSSSSQTGVGPFSLSATATLSESSKLTKGEFKKLIISEFYEGRNPLGLKEINEIYASYQQELVGECGKCQVKRARRRYKTLIENLLSEKGVI